MTNRDATVIYGNLLEFMLLTMYAASMLSVI